MLRIHYLQQWYALSDPAVEEALYDSAAMRRFVGIDLGREPAPDETTACKFRHLLEKHVLAADLFATVNRCLYDHGMRLSQGTIVDATIINAPSATKNRDKQRDRQMRQTRKGNQWYLGMKAHIGIDERTGLVHSVVTIGANRADVTQVGRLLHGAEIMVFGDAGHIGAAKRASRRTRTWHIAAKRGALGPLASGEAFLIGAGGAEALGMTALGDGIFGGMTGVMGIFGSLPDQNAEHGFWQHQPDPSCAPLAEPPIPQPNYTFPWPSMVW
jgi:IS5 family transposase